MGDQQPGVFTPFITIGEYLPDDLIHVFFKFRGRGMIAVYADIIGPQLKQDDIGIDPRQNLFLLQKTQIFPGGMALDALVDDSGREPFLVQSFL